MDVAQPIWLSGCPKEDLFIAKNALLPFLDARAEIEKKKLFIFWRNRKQEKTISGLFTFKELQFYFLKFLKMY